MEDAVSNSIDITLSPLPRSSSTLAGRAGCLSCERLPHLLLMLPSFAAFCVVEQAIPGEPRHHFSVLLCVEWPFSTTRSRLIIRVVDQPVPRCEPKASDKVEFQQDWTQEMDCANEYPSTGPGRWGRPNGQV